MKKIIILVIILSLRSFPSFGKIGDNYICNPIEKISSWGKQLRHKSTKELIKPNYIIKFEWLENSILFKSLRLQFPIISTFKDEESFESFDGLNKITYNEGFLIWTMNQQNPTLNFALDTYNCKKY